MIEDIVYNLDFTIEPYPGEDQEEFMDRCVQEVEDQDPGIGYYDRYQACDYFFTEYEKSARGELGYNEDVENTLSPGLRGVKSP